MNLKMIDARANDRASLGTDGEVGERRGERMTECLGGFWVSLSASPRARLRPLGWLYSVFYTVTKFADRLK